MNRLILSTRISSLMLCMLVAVNPGASQAGSTNLGSQVDIKQSSLWQRSNLVAWCIVPFDSQKRSPAQRVAMLKELGIQRFAYDYRAEHLPSFDEEVALLKANHIELTAVWFPTQLNDQARLIMDLLAKHQMKTQLWVMGGGDLKMNAEQETRFIESEVARLRPIAEAAKNIGCQVALYNHGNWFGEPENQLRVIEQLKLDNVGIVYNLHHAHSQIDRLPSILEKIKPHLLALNLNGMRTGGDQMGHKILPIGEGDRDVEILRQIVASGYNGPIGILNHTDEDAGLRLQDNLDGLEWCLKRSAEDLAAPKPVWKSYRGVAAFQLSLPKQIANLANKEGDAGEGLKVFASATTGCVACHKVGEFGGKVGPDLSTIGAKRVPEHIVTSLLWPNHEIEPAFQTHRFLLEDGRILTGFRSERDENKIVIRDAGTNTETIVSKGDIESEKPASSVMPEALVASLSRRDQLNLIAFVSKLGKEESLKPEIMASVLKHSRGHKVTDFPWTAAPLDPENHPWHKADINRDRVYDFYQQQANYFRTQALGADLFTEYPGLDGKNFGHWGNQDEKFWAGDESNSANLGGFVCHTFKNGKQVITRAVCARLGDDGKATAVFNVDSLQFEAFWQGDIVYSSVRHGFLDGVKPDFNTVTLVPAIEHNGPTRYLGFYRHKNAPVFSYTVGGVEYLDSADFIGGELKRTRLPATEHPLRACLRGSEPQDVNLINTPIENGQGDSFVLDTIHVPMENRWKAPFFGGDLGFRRDGSIYMTTMFGDVWHVDGFQSPMSKNATWKRFATGLHQPLGLVVHDDQCYVLGRNQITRLHDLNQDGEADWYECFSKAYESSPAGHDFICGLQRDSAGNFYTVSGKQGLLQISPDGQRADVLATGFRNPDGLGLLPDGTLTIPCSEGDWTPASMICWRSPSQTGVPFYGHRGPAVGGRPELPLIYLPRGIDNSSGGQVYVSSDRWGAMKGSLIHFSHGTGTAMHLMVDQVGKQVQGAISVLPVEFRSGAHRGRFSPNDDQLYVVGMNGWGSYAPETGCLQRLRYPSTESIVPIGFHVRESGIELRLSRSIENASSIKQSLLDIKSYFSQAWNYRYGPNYGSAEYSTRHPGVRGHDRMRITGVHLIDNGKTLFLEMPDLQPVNQLHIHANFPGRQPWNLFATIHQLDKPRADLPGYKPIAKQISPHPLDSDLQLALRKKVNPWRKRLQDATAIEIEAGQNLSYTKKELRVKAGEPVALTFKNPDVVPHNWALVKPGSLQRVGELANRLIGDPDAAINNYIPTSDDVICFTDIVEGQDETIIYFKAPDVTGRYPYLCTFPGHWMVMNGEMIVE
jgi:putative heme-binding domain-containing protein